MPKIIFHPDVAQDIDESYKWYQEQASGLGVDFIVELEAAYEVIAELPDTWPKFGMNCRRFLLEKFPFSVIYQIKDGSIFVLAVMHIPFTPKNTHFQRTSFRKWRRCRTLK